MSEQTAEAKSTRESSPSTPPRKPRNIPLILLILGVCNSFAIACYFFFFALASRRFGIGLDGLIIFCMNALAVPCIELALFLQRRKLRKREKAFEKGTEMVKNWKTNLQNGYIYFFVVLSFVLCIYKINSLFITLLYNRNNAPSIFDFIFVVTFCLYLLFIWLRLNYKKISIKPFASLYPFLYACVFVWIFAPLLHLLALQFAPLNFSRELQYPYAMQYYAINFFLGLLGLGVLLLWRVLALATKRISMTLFFKEIRSLFSALVPALGAFYVCLFFAHLLKEFLIPIAHMLNAL